jgi:hypothetical protein
MTKWQWHDPNGRLREVAIPREGVTSPTGQALYKQMYGNALVGYVKLNRFNPLAARAFRVSSIRGAADTALLGGKWWQIFSAPHATWRTAGVIHSSAQCRERRWWA